MKRHRTSEERAKRIVKAARDNPDMSPTELARRFGCNRKLIREVLAQHGIVRSRPAGTMLPNGPPT